MAVKNCMNTDIEVDGKHGSVTIKPGKYESFEPSSSDKYGEVYWKKFDWICDKMKNDKNQV